MDFKIGSRNGSGRCFSGAPRTKKRMSFDDAARLDLRIAAPSPHIPASKRFKASTRSEGSGTTASSRKSSGDDDLTKDLNNLNRDPRTQAIFVGRCVSDLLSEEAQNFRGMGIYRESLPNFDHAQAAIDRLYDSPGAFGHEGLMEDVPLYRGKTTSRKARLLKEKVSRAAAGGRREEGSGTGGSKRNANAGGGGSCGSENCSDEACNERNRSGPADGADGAEPEVDEDAAAAHSHEEDGQHGDHAAARTKSEHNHEHDHAVTAEGDDGELRRRLTASINRLLHPLVSRGLPADLVSQVRGDAVEIGLATAELLPDASSLILKLELMRENVCARWHQDYYVSRAIVSYNHSATEFVHDGCVDFWQLRNQGGNDRIVKRAEETQNIGVGNILFMKGHYFPTTKPNALVHRSPDIVRRWDGSVPTRLVLKVDVDDL